MHAQKMPIQRYSRIAMILHWLIAVLITLNVALIWSVNLIPEDNIRFVIDAHKSFGITVLGLVLMRLLWRAANRPPDLPETYPPAEKAAAHGAHLALYVLMIGLPLSGWMRTIPPGRRPAKFQCTCSACSSGHALAGSCRSSRPSRNACTTSSAAFTCGCPMRSMRWSACTSPPR
jgi:cytochrome b561